MTIVTTMFYLGLTQAQVSMDFSLGGSGLEAWQGDTAHFTINETEMLQLDADTSGASFIYQSLDFLPSTWKLDLDLDFDPSISNRLRLHLLLDTDDLNRATGIFLELGENGASDVWSCYKLRDGQAELLGTGRINLAEAPNIALEVKRTNDNRWTFQTNKMLDLEFTESIEIPTHPFFGIWCLYTETRKDKFFFDNLFISADNEPDTTAPELQDLHIIDDHSVVLRFSESLDATSANNQANYVITPDIGFPSEAKLGTKQTDVTLVFSTSFQSDQTYILTINQIKDASGNAADTKIDSFTYTTEQTIEPYSVLINEIYDDPTPSQGIPEVEYIEICLSRSTIAFEASDLMFINGDRSVILPDIEMNPGEYYLLCDAAHADVLSSYGKVIGINNFPSLRNGGNSLALETMDGSLIHAVHYDDSWFGDATKKDGGWSLELINPNDPCALDQNWTGATSIIGGSPGKQNTVFDTTREIMLPALLHTEIAATQQLNLLFDKSLGNVDIADFLLFGGQAMISNMHLNGPNQNEVILEVSPSLQTGVDYVVDIIGLTDCQMQEIPDQELVVRLPDLPMPGDLIINEILFNPATGGSDFVEIFNASEKTFKASDLYLANLQDGNAAAEQLSSDLTIFSGTYLVLSENPQDILERYRVAEPSDLLLNDLPGLPNDAGNVTLYTVRDGAPVVIDAVDYDKSFHTSLLKVQDGVSIERISPKLSSQSPHNWHSAAASVGYATPTAPNSQLISLTMGEQVFELNDKVFSPDGDGYQDILSIEYEIPEEGMLATTKIYDSAGRLTRVLTDNISLATNGLITWDGTNEDGHKANIGIYTILLEAFNLAGTKIRWKETCVVAGRLD